MTNNFEDYANYYDLLYRDKEYSKEVDYIEGLIKNHSESSTNTILNLGCGTGKHDFLLAEKGYNITGVDISKDMIYNAKSKYPDLNFLKDDVRTLKLNRTFDTVISLFHVASYQTSNADLQSYFKTAADHLKDGGLFIFDFWYGPAVLSERPSVRIKELENDNLYLKRLSTPKMIPNDNVVEVIFEVEILDKKNNTTSTIKEEHRMRYLFLPEIKKHALDLGFELINDLKWMTNDNLGFDSWYGVVILKKTKQL